jgi:Rrf2 family transcriptional regulator, nitric oxide-sensitive transcriptional repressor
MLPKTSDYALRAVIALAREPHKRTSAQQLSKLTNVPRRYLHKVLQALTRAKLLRSQPGPGGGYSLRYESNHISVLDVIEAIVPLERLQHCPLGLPSHIGICPLHARLNQAYLAMESTFRRLMIADLLDSV